MKSCPIPHTDQVVWTCFKCTEEKAEEHRREEIEKEKKRRQEIMNRRIDNTMLSPRFKNKTFENYNIQNDKQAKVVEDIGKFIKNFDNSAGLIFLGNNGTGKNHLASAVINEMVRKHNKTAVATEAIKIIRQIKETWRRQPDQHEPGKLNLESEVIKFFVNPDLLVIDEIGIQYGSPTEKMYITEIINDRYGAMKPTILCANLTMKELTGVLGERVMSRMSESDYKGNKIIIFNWKSYRGKV